MKLLLIAGHGAGDPGAVSGVFQEAVETRRVVGALVRLLKGYCEVTQYPPARNAFSDFRTGQLNKQVPLSDFDFVLEIHFNASAAGPKDGKTKGVEIFVPTGAAETAEEEQICRAVAAVGLTNRGLKRYNWAVINAAHRAGVRSALLEVCFIDDPDDMLVYTTKFDAVIQAIANAIITQFSLKKEEKPVTYEEFAAFMDRYLTNRAKLAPSAWSNEARAWAEKANIVQGSSDGEKKYQSFVTREELVQMLFRSK